ncbi:uncharacterized protein [Panulirus ornatus]|uniref:uncharacterized protein isoform X1 n=1 Tax=Panulirus ornatus TaxID=150431 RepID=UPI003A88F350
MRFTQIDSQSATFVESLQGHPVSSYVTLSGQHTISGETTFLDVLWTPRVHAASSLDGVHVATDSILLTTTVQNHTGSLACGTLEVDSLQVNTINDINIDHLLQSLVTRDAAASITGHVRILGDLIYPGNLEVNLTSSVDLINPLRTDDKNLQLVTGQHRVESVRSQSVRVAGRVNSVRVPEDVFLRRAGHSYTVQSAAFTQVLASSVAISTALDTITVQDNQLAVLKVRGDQVVTASKTFSSIHLLQDDLYSSYSTSGGRRRRDTSGSSEQSCGLFDSSSRDLTEAEARREALMWGVRSAAVAEDLLSILDASEPNMLTLLQHNAQFFSRLAQDVPCAFPYRGYEVLFSDILGSDWRDEDNMTVTFTKEDIERSLDTIEKHVRNVTEELSHLHLEWQDVLSVYIDAKRNMKSDDESLLITDLLKILFDENIRHNYTRSDDTEDCRMICSVGHQGTTDFAQREENCGTAISLIQKVLRRITGYPSIIQNMALVSGFKSRALQTAVVEHDLGKLLQVIKDEAGLQQALSAAVQCQVAPARRTDNREVVRMLTSYGREQRKFAVFTFGGNNRIAVPGPTRVSADSVPSSLPPDLPRPRAAGRVTPEDMGDIEGSLSASRSGSLTPLKQTKSLPVDVVEVSSTDGHSPAESDGPNSSAGIEFETIGMEKTESLGSLTNTSDMGKLHAGGSDETKGLSRRTRGVSDPSEAVESFISVLQSYLDDIKENRGDVSIVVSKWNGRDLISEFNEMEKVFYQNPETITDDAERKILILHKLVDDIKNAVMAFEDSERKVASQARLKSSEPQMEEDVEGNASAMERNDVFSDPVVESPLTPGSTPGETAAEGTTISATKEESNIEDSTGEEPTN